FHRYRLGKGAPHTVEQIAECGFAVGLAHGPIEAAGALQAGQLAVVRETPVAPPQFTAEGMGIDQTDLADVGLTDMADDHFAFDRVALHQLRHLGLAARPRVLEQAQIALLIETDAPAIAMRAGATTALHQPGETEDDIGGYIGAHAEQFAHRINSPCLGSGANARLRGADAYQVACEAAAKTPQQAQGSSQIRGSIRPPRSRP